MIHSCIVNNFATKTLSDCVCYCLLRRYADNIVMFIKIINMNWISSTVVRHYRVRIKPPTELLRRILITTSGVITIDTIESNSYTIPIFCIACNLVQHIVNQLVACLRQFSFLSIFAFNNIINNNYYDYKKNIWPHLCFSPVSKFYILELYHSASMESRLSGRLCVTSKFIVNMRLLVAGEIEDGDETLDQVLIGGVKSITRAR